MSLMVKSKSNLKELDNDMTEIGKDIKRDWKQFKSDLNDKIDAMQEKID